MRFCALIEIHGRVECKKPRSRPFNAPPPTDSLRRGDVTALILICSAALAIGFVAPAMAQQSMHRYVQRLRKNERAALPGFSDLSRHIAFALVDGARHLPRWSIRTALKLKSAFCAVVFAGAVEHRCIVIHQSASGGQLLAAGAEVKVALSSPLHLRLFLCRSWSRVSRELEFRDFGRRPELTRANRRLGRTGIKFPALTLKFPPKAPPY